MPSVFAVAPATLFVTSLCNVAIVAQERSSDRPPPKPAEGVASILKAAAVHQVVAIEELPGCEQVHEFVRRLLVNPAFPAAIRELVVDFGNPRFQAVLDRFIASDQAVPRSELCHVWRETPESLQLTFDSPVYERFLETVRAVNSKLAADQRLHVTLAGPPIDWTAVHAKSDLVPFLGEARGRALADAVDAAVARGGRVLVISSLLHLRSWLAKTDPQRVHVIWSQGRLGGDDRYRDVETAESKWEWYSIAVLRDTSFATLPLNGAADSPRLQEVADALLYLGPSSTLTVLRPCADAFQDDDYWNELNRRSRAVNDAPFSLAKAGFDLRLVPRRDPDARVAAAPAVSPASAASNRSEPAKDGVDFILYALDDHAMVGLEDDHRGLGFCEFLERLLRDPRLPGRVDDVVVESGNPRFQSVTDRYVVAGEAVARDERKGAWQYAAMGWETADSPIYEHLIDVARDVNAGLPPSKRMRVVLGDAPIDPIELRKDARACLHDFLMYNETARDPRELSLAASANAVISHGRHGLMICGGGHLALGKRAGNAREFIEKENAGEFLDLAHDFPESEPPGSVRLDEDVAILSLGPWKDRREVGIPPLVFRDPQYWSDINQVHQIARGKSIDLHVERLVYRGLLFDAPLPTWLRNAADSN